MFNRGRFCAVNPQEPMWVRALRVLITILSSVWAVIQTIAGFAAWFAWKLRWFFAGFVTISTLLWVWCWLSDETIGLEKDGHHLREPFRIVLLSCAKGNEKAATTAFVDGLSAQQIEVSMTPWWDNTRLGELYLGGIAFDTLGAGQIHWQTALDTYQQYADDPELNRFLGLSESYVTTLKAGDVSRFQVIRWLQLRGNGSPLLSMLHTLWLRKQLVGRAKGQNSSLLIERTRQVYEAANDRIGEYGLHGNDAERAYARKKLTQSFDLRIDERASLYILSSYATGIGHAHMADIQAMINEEHLIHGLESSLDVDGHWGKGTKKAVLDYLSVETVDVNKIDELHNQIQSRWKRQTEPGVVEICRTALETGDSRLIEGLLHNRYAGQVSVYNALNSLYVVGCQQLRATNGEIDGQKACQALHQRVAGCWEVWMTERKGPLWDVFGSDEAFQKIFPPETRLARETLVRHAAHYFLLFRLAPRQLGVDVSLQYVPKSHIWGIPVLPTKAEINPERRLIILSTERRWLIDPP